MKTVTVHAAKTHLSRLIEKAEAGEEVVIAHGKVPAVRLVPVRPKNPNVASEPTGAAPACRPPSSPPSEAELKAWGL